MAFAKAGE